MGAALGLKRHGDNDMSTQPYDAVAQGLARITGQPVGRPKFTAFLQALLQEVADDMTFAALLYTCIDIDSSEGVQLDVIGRIVGQSRTLYRMLALPFFGFASENGGDYQVPAGYGDNAYPTQGAAFFNNGQSSTASSQADDALFRRMIAMRILKNALRMDGTQTAPWIEVLNKLLLDIFPDAAGAAYPLGIADNGGMTLEFFVGVKPSAVQTSLLLYAGLLPIPMGVGYSVTWWDHTLGVFGFADTPGALGYGDNVHPAQGGVFAERLG